MDHQIQFITIRKFPSQNELLQWVREEASKLVFFVVLRRRKNGRNGRSLFIIVICERGGSYTKYNNLFKHKIFGMGKCGVIFRAKCYLLISSDWILEFRLRTYNHEMTKC